MTILQGDNYLSLSGRTALGLFQSIAHTFRFFSGILEFVSNILPGAKIALMAEDCLVQAKASETVFGFKLLTQLKLPYKYEELSPHQMREIEKSRCSANPINLDDIKVDEVILF